MSRTLLDRLRVGPGSVVGLLHVALLILVSTFVALPVLADDAPARDPVLDDVISMLSADLSEELVREWISAFGKKPAMPTAADMVALREAGASEELLSLLLELAVKPGETERPEDGGPCPDCPEEDSTATKQPAAEPATPESASPESASPESASPEAASPESAKPESTADASDGTVPVRFRLRYSPKWLEDETEWDFYVYLDGRPLAYVPEKSLLSGDDVEISRPLALGEHTLRVARERHVERRGRWTHEARVAEEAFTFELREGGDPAIVEVVFNQSLLKFDDPLSYRFQQGRRVDVREELGGRPDRWTELCEEVETGIDGDPSRAERRRLGDCVRWSTLWADDAPPRDEVREAMARFDYRPVPKTESLF